MAPTISKWPSLLPAVNDTAAIIEEAGLIFHGVAANGDAAKVKISYTAFDTPFTTESDLVRVDGKWKIASVE